MHGFDVYRTYLAMKLHFSNDKFDFFQYEGKVNAKEETYQQRNDFYFFETLARKRRRLKSSCSRPLWRQRTQRRSGLAISNQLVKIAGWYGQNCIRVSPTLLSKILTQWLNIWNPRGIPLTIFLKRWEDILHSSSSTSNDELI
jgi:hypothetical protein